MAVERLQRCAETAVGEEIQRINFEQFFEALRGLFVVPPPALQIRHRLQGDGVARSDFQGAGEAALRFVEAFQERQGLTERGVRVDRVRDEFDRQQSLFVAFLDAALLDQRAYEVGARAAGDGIVGDDVAEEGDLVAVDARVAPTQRAEDREHRCEDGCRGWLDASVQGRGAMGRGAHKHGGQADARQILKAVRDE